MARVVLVGDLGFGLVRVLNMGVRSEVERRSNPTDPSFPWSLG